MKKIWVFYLAVPAGLSLGTIGCDWLSPPKQPPPLKSTSNENRIVKPAGDQSSRYQLFSVEEKSGGTTKTLVFRLDSTNGTTWKLDADF